MADEKPKVIYPPPDRWWVRAFRFLNVLDPDENMFSPTRVQAWGATAGAIYTTVSADFSKLADVGHSALAVGYAGLATLIHIKNKNDRTDAQVKLANAGNGE